MRLPSYIGLIAAAGLSALATAYALRSTDIPLTPSAQNKALLERFDLLQDSLEGINNGLKTIDTNLERLAGATPVFGPAIGADGGAHGAVPPGASAIPQPPGTATANPTPTMTIVNPSPEQSAYFEMMKERLDDPGYVQNMSLAELDNKDLKALPPVMRQAILMLAVQKFNNGEVTKIFSIPKAEDAQNMPQSTN